MEHELHHGRNASSLLADQPAMRSFELELGRSVRLVAEFVLQTFERNRIARAVRQPARHEEATRSLLGLGHGEDDTGPRGRADPLVTRQEILAAWPGLARRFGKR